MSSPVPDTSKPANFSNLIRLVAEQLELSTGDAKLVTMTVMQGIVQLASEHPYLKLKEFGNFEYRTMAARLSTSPIHQTTVKLPERQILKFVCSQTLHKAV